MNRQIERVLLGLELTEIERRLEQLRYRLGLVDDDDNDPVPEHMRINVPANRSRALLRIAAMEARSQEILQKLWPIDEAEV